MMRRLLVLLALVAATPAWSQATIMQGGTWSQGHVPAYTVQGGSNPVVMDSGPAGGGAYQGISELLLTVIGSGTAPYASAGTGPYGTNFCDYDAPTTNATGYHYLCFSPNAQGGGLIAYGNGGGAAALPLSFKVNGATYNFPFSASGVTGPGSSTVNHFAVWNNGGGSLLADAPSGTGVLTALANATNGAGGVLTTDGTATLTSKTFDTGGFGNIFRIAGVQISAITGTGANVLQTSPTLITPVITSPTESAGTYTSPTFAGTASGSVTSAVIAGTTAVGGASSGFLGEYISATSGTTSLSSATPINLATISLTAGDWDCFANAIFTPAGTTVMTNAYLWMSTASATLPTPPNNGGFAQFNVSVTGLQQGFTTSVMRVNVNTTTTLFLGAQSTFTVSTETANGFIGCRRMR